MCNYITGVSWFQNPDHEIYSGLSNCSLFNTCKHKTLYKIVRGETLKFTDHWHTSKRSAWFSTVAINRIVSQPISDVSDTAVSTSK